LSRATSCVMLVVLSSLVSCVNERSTDGDELSRAVHLWSSVDFPSIPLQVEQSRVILNCISVYNTTSDDGSIILQFQAKNVSAPLSPNLPAFLASVQVRLHTPAMAYLPLPETRDCSRREMHRRYGRRGSSNYWLFNYRLPPVGEPLGDAWIELRFSELSCRLELPYGFCGATGERPQPHEQASTPQPSSEQAEKPRTSREVPWETVVYGLDQGLGRWSVNVGFSDDAVGGCSLSVYPPTDDDGRTPAWQVMDLKSPKTSVSVTDSDGTVRAGRVVSSSFPSGVRCRHDVVRFPPYVREGREWGKLTVRVGDRTSSITIPSSLY